MLIIMLKFTIVSVGVESEVDGLRLDHEKLAHNVSGAVCLIIYYQIVMNLKDKLLKTAGSFYT